MLKSPMMKKFRMKDVLYDLPQEKIRIHPPADRGSSKLLLMNQCNDSSATTLADSRFSDSICGFIPSNAHFILNNSKVVNARLWVEGIEPKVEVMLLNPDFPSVDPRACLALPAQGQHWSCMIRKLCVVGEELSTVAMNTKGISPGFTLKVKVVRIDEIWEEEEMEEGTGCRVEISIGPIAGTVFSHASVSMGEVLTLYGDVPIPPYLYRDTTASDKDSYQTVYAAADREGSVAAPTAGLHFTPEVLDALEEKGVRTTRLALHVSAGTFKPVTAECISEHDMHEESFTATIKDLLALAQSDAEGRLIVSVGTTSVRVSESLYWLGVKALLLEKDGGLSIEEGTETDKEAGSSRQSRLALGQWEPGELRLRWQNYTTQMNMPSPSSTHTPTPNPVPVPMPTLTQAFSALTPWSTSTTMEGDLELSGTTSLCIVPGYEFMVTRGALLTNFHQPDSTLMLLVAAFLCSSSGDDDSSDDKHDDVERSGVEALHKLYKHALENDYYFLSYGDCCLLTKYDVYKK